MSGEFLVKYPHEKFGCSIFKDGSGPIKFIFEIEGADTTYNDSEFGSSKKSRSRNSSFNFRVVLYDIDSVKP